MKSSAEYLVLADQMQAKATASLNDRLRDGYAPMAAEWRKIADLTLRLEHLERRRESAVDL